MNKINIDILEENRIATARRLTFTSVLISLFYHLIFTVYIHPPTYIIVLNILLSFIYFFPVILTNSRKSYFGKFLSFTIGNMQLLSAAFFFGAEAGFQYLLLDKLVAINFIFGNSDKKSRRYKYFSNFYTITCFLIANLFFSQKNAFVKITPEETVVLKVSAIIFCSIIIFVTTFVFFKDVTKLENKLSSEYKKNDILLNSLLPKEIIKQWDDNHDMRSSFYHKDASIMFIKISNFNTITKALEVYEKLQILNYTYTIFDELIEEFGLEKIKIIGNSYMVAGGIPHYNALHLKNMIDAAQKIEKKFIEICTSLNLKMEIKIGIHNGELASGVVGKQKILYDVWGETVNKASRLCDISKDKQIVISKEIFEKCDCEYDVIKIATLDIKGLGKVDTYEII